MKNQTSKLKRLNIKIIRPGYGINPIYYDQILNKKSPIKINIHEKIDKKILKKLKIKIIV